MFVNRSGQKLEIQTQTIPLFIFRGLGIVVAEVGDTDTLHLSLFVEVIKDQLGHDKDFALPSFSD
jgi:hypothetical protein